MIEKRIAVQRGDILLLHTGWHAYADFGATPDEERYYHYHPGAHPDLVPWLLEKQVHVWGVDCVSTDHPMNLPIGRFLGKGAQGHCDRVRAKAEKTPPTSSPTTRCSRKTASTSRTWAARSRRPSSRTSG